MIQSKELSQSDNSLMDKVRTLYEQSFPVDERRDFDAFRALVGRTDVPFHVYVYARDGEFAGFITCWEWDDMRYFEHFAVEPSMRNGGLGARILADVLAASSVPAVLEAELPDTDMARRRIGFYERNGFTARMDIPYLQPAYGRDKQPLPLCLMTWGGLCLDGPDDEKIRRIKRAVYGCNL